MNIENHYPIGARVYVGPQTFAPAGTPENPNPVAPPRPTGVVRGIQALEEPLAYLVVKDADGSNEWMADFNVELVPEEAAAAA